MTKKTKQSRDGDVFIQRVQELQNSHDESMDDLDYNALPAEKSAPLPAKSTTATSVHPFISNNQVGGPIDIEKLREAMVVKLMEIANGPDPKNALSSIALLGKVRGIEMFKETGTPDPTAGLTAEQLEQNIKDKLRKFLAGGALVLPNAEDELSEVEIEVKSAKQVATRERKETERGEEAKKKAKADKAAAKRKAKVGGKPDVAK